MTTVDKHLPVEVNQTHATFRSVDFVITAESRRRAGPLYKLRIITSTGLKRNLATFGILKSCADAIVDVERG